MVEWSIFPTSLTTDWLIFRRLTCVYLLVGEAYVRYIWTWKVMDALVMWLLAWKVYWPCSWALILLSKIAAWYLQWQNRRTVPDVKKGNLLLSGLSNIAVWVQTVWMCHKQQPHKKRNVFLKWAFCFFGLYKDIGWPSAIFMHLEVQNQETAQESECC